MTVPRVDRRRQCEGKVRHPDRRTARTARQRTPASRGGHLHIYRCPWCHHYHLGTSWTDPYVADMIARRDQMPDDTIDDDVARATARVLGITIAEAHALNTDDGASTA